MRGPPAMILAGDDCAAEIVAHREQGEVRLAVEVRARGFRGVHDEVWMDRARLEAFVADVRRLEAERSGQAVLESWSPGEFRLAFRVTDAAGHIGVEVTLARHHYGRFGRHRNTVGCDLEVPAESLVALIDDFEEELGVA